ncbi:MAG TPA: zinc transporter ZupT [Bacteroidales bacterium]|nr:MAG: Zinc transporter ZupT [Bacteroidetes bacterium ADurb.Bin037]HPV88607.1 zinc transporter ZupT [Bacteroidales bacterium]HPW77773.1 zinc transporter ZupT [Bacteroidales bacterium]HQB55600.1 zinc transporter ZupT [Bacteroidales bacterium]
MNSRILIPFLLSLLAGLATLIGFFITFIAKKTNRKLLSFSLGLSAGVMIYVAFVEIFVESRSILAKNLGERQGLLLTVIFFFIGMAIIALIDRFVPSCGNPHEAYSVEELDEGVTCMKKPGLMKMGIMTAIAIAVHNFPEGIATFMAALENPTLGIAIATAIAIHNIPEGIAISIPIYYATGSRKKAFGITLLSGLAEPLGALLTYLILMPFFTPVVMGCLFAVVAGIMVFISIDELLPGAHKYGEHHVAIYGLISGMAVMALSLILFA